jgi:allose kinase
MTTAPDARIKAVRQPVLVIDIGGTGIKIGYSIDRRPQIFRNIFSTQTLRDGDPVAALAAMVEGAVAQTGIAPGFIVATVPGFIDTDGDHVLFAGNIPSLNGRALASELSHSVGCPVLLERDAVLLLTGETLAGVVQDGEHVLGLFFGTGIGTAYLQNGTPFRGGGWALELGLMPFRGDGRILSGMRTDCLEAYCSGRVLRDIGTRHGVEVGGVFRAAESMPLLAEELAAFVRYQAFAVGCAVAMVSPQTIVLGGGVLDIVGYPKDRLVALVAEHAPIAETGRPMDLRWAQLGWTSVLHAAPLVVAEHLARGDDLLQGRKIKTAAG